jgi:hypothetical protein
MANILADALGSAAAAVNPVSAIADLGRDLIDKFIPDPEKKAAAQLAILDKQNQMNLAVIDQQNKVIEAAQANMKDDHYMKWMRAFFCFIMTVLYVWNYAGCRFFSQTPVDLPTSMHVMFATIMLGFVGIPAGIEMAKQVAGMNGDSNVKLLGGVITAGNKS